MRITVRREGNGLNELIADLIAVPGKVYGEGTAIVHRDGERAKRFARNVARRNAGPHGALFYKRITAEMTGPLTSEIGPTAPASGHYTGVDDPAGPGRDLDEAFAKIRPVFGKHASEFMDELL
ncbi:MAG TPA: hypothetical protein VIP28_13095 [Nocardioides sp.]